ncbi:MAG TPA: hypothetical protein PLD88_07400 [Candidatus Berkiella sp.]|nr:hypothetical protein [Candidatus Berkiella sp.]
MFDYEQLVAIFTTTRVTKVMLMAAGVTLLIHGTYHQLRGQQMLGGILTLFPFTLHYSFATLFALTSSAESLELIAYLPLIQLERWQEMNEIIVQGMKLIGYLSIAAGMYGFGQYYYKGRQILPVSDCLLLNSVGFVFIYFVDISHLISRMIDKIS